MKTTSKFFIAILLAVTTAACVPAYQQKGYASESDYQFSQSLGNPTPKRVAELKAFGITNRQQLDAVIAEMNNINYSSNNDNWDAIFNYLNDRVVSQKNKISILQAKKNREKAEQIARRQVEEEEQRKRKEFAKNYPYTATVSCEFSGQHTNLAACFLGKHKVHTQIEIKNGSQYAFYQPWDLEKLGQETSAGVTIPLGRSFSIKAQNASSSLTLNLVIRDAASGKVMWQKSVGEYGVISVGN